VTLTDFEQRQVVIKGITDQVPILSSIPSFLRMWLKFCLTSRVYFARFVQKLEKLSNCSPTGIASTSWKTWSQRKSHPCDEISISLLKLLAFPFSFSFFIFFLGNGQGLFNKTSCYYRRTTNKSLGLNCTSTPESAPAKLWVEIASCSSLLSKVSVIRTVAVFFGCRPRAGGKRLFLEGGGDDIRGKVKIFTKVDDSLVG